ncbi:MAG: hypothetical protein LBG88_03870 [Christensenellaceae bacterium]|jgi:hypothetical protein|nr:hypothetical protein [Christensenellaceae bacterium]
MYGKVTCDLFNIAERLKKINRDYRLYRNNRDMRFEVHGGKARTPSGWTLAFVVPFERLDARVLDYALRTRKQNYTQIEHEIARHNDAIQKSIFANLENKKQDLEDMLTFATRTGRTVLFTKNYTKEF